MINRKTLLFLAGLCGFAVANIYYNQTLFLLIAQSFSKSIATVSLLSSLIQLSYAAGLIIIVPLADSICRKRLIISLLIAGSIAQVFAALAPNFSTLIVCSIVIGLTSVSAQIIIPAVTLVSTKEDKGKNVGLLIGGLAGGVVMARFISGFVGHYMGWRSMHWIAAIICLSFIPVVAKFFPKIPLLTKTKYITLLHSLVKIFISEPTLQKSSISAAIIFCAFSGVWGSLAYLLSLPPFGYGSSVAGMLALVGFIGVFASKYIGSYADKVGASTLVRLVPLLTIAAGILLLAIKISILFLIITMILLDLMNRTSLIGNQLINYSLDAGNRSRINSIFMFLFFIGGAIGTHLGVAISVKFNWLGLSFFLLGCAISAIVVSRLHNPLKCPERN